MFSVQRAVSLSKWQCNPILIWGRHARTSDFQGKYSLLLKAHWTALIITKIYPKTSNGFAVFLSSCTSCQAYSIVMTFPDMETGTNFTLTHNFGKDFTGIYKMNYLVFFNKAKKKTKKNAYVPQMFIYTLSCIPVFLHFWFFGLQLCTKKS